MIRELIGEVNVRAIEAPLRAEIARLQAEVEHEWQRAERYRDAIEAIRQVSTGEEQVADDDTEAMGVIAEMCCRVLVKLAPPQPQNATAVLGWLGTSENYTVDLRKLHSAPEAPATDLPRFADGTVDLIGVLRQAVAPDAGPSDSEMLDAVIRGWVVDECAWVGNSEIVWSRHTNKFYVGECEFDEGREAIRAAMKEQGR